MKIAIVAPSPVPFLIGGAEKFWWGLQHSLNQLTPHVVELIKIPCRDSDFWGLMDAYEQISRLDLSYFDMVVSSKYPAWMVAHHNHHCYMQHTCRGVYDLYRGETGRDFLPSHPALDRLYRLLFEEPPDRSLLVPIFAELWRLRSRDLIAPGKVAFEQPLARAIIHRLDQIGLATSAIQRYSAISRNVANRTGYLPSGVPVAINHHPTDLSGLHSSAYRTIFTASRLARLKRIDLLIKAFKQVDADIEFRIAGTGSEEQPLKQLAAGDSRIKFLGFQPDARIVEEYAQALFVPFVPFDEDYGLITVEAMQSAKAVLTSHDSGGVHELVVHGESGLSVAPDSEALAEAMTQLLADRQATIAMGLKAQEQAASINWHRTVSLLLGDDMPAPATTRRRKLVVVSTSPVFPPQGGGQYRTWHISRELARDADVCIVALGKAGDTPAVTSIISGLKEIRVPRTAGQHQRAVQLQAELGVSADDIANIDDWQENAEFTEHLQRELATADIVLVVNPYLYNAVRESGFHGAIWYDAHDVAIDIKTAMLPKTEEASHYLQKVAAVEQACITAADRLFTCSEHDARRLAQLYDRNTKDFLTVSNGADIGAARPVTRQQRQQLKKQLGLDEKPVLLFMASWHGPNVEALPLLVRCAEKLTSGSILLTGSLCAHPDAQNLPANIRCLGVLDEEAKQLVLQASDLALNLVTSGSGTNLKMLEYAAWGIPIITTPFGNRGLDFIPDEHLIVAEANDLPQRAADLAADLDSLQPLAVRAHAIVRLCYDWPGLVAPLRELLNSSSTPVF
jgi:glycosyltransferase involved in cell wall biosynthesis